MIFIRLQKYMADCGIASRRQSEAMIAEGRVRVNGKIVKVQGVKINPETDCVSVDGKDIKVKDEYLFYMLNKPAGYLTTTSDPQNRPTIFDLCPELRGRVVPV